MIKKLTALFAIITIILSLAACKEEELEPTHKTGWNNPEEPVTQQTTAAPEETTLAPEITTEAAATEAATEITFSEGDALTIGSFLSEVYGRLTVYLQDEHFLVIDEFKDQKFTIYAEGYSPAKTEDTVFPIFTDMNFDGFTDFGVCYYKDTLNSYFFCFLWNNTTRSFDYTHSLTNLANPDFDPVTRQITSIERLTATSATEKTFSFAADGTLSHLATNEISEEPATDGAEIIDSNLQIAPSGDKVTFTMAVNQNSHSKWQCLIDDETIVAVASEGPTSNETIYEFVLTSLKPGATTVIFRYASVVTGDYIEEIIVNALVKEDMEIQIVIPE